MPIVDILFIAVGLSMDAFAVALTLGGTIKTDGIKEAIVVGVSFGAFQAFMPTVGWFGGKSVAMYIKSLDHWIAFFLLAFVGLKMIIESFKLEPGCNFNLCFKTLLVLSIATSIDALAVGITFSFLRISITLPVLIIGIVTLLLSASGVIFGSKIKKLCPKWFGFFGGLVLLTIGIKILIEHLQTQ